MVERKVVMITLPSPWLISDKDLPNLGVLGIASYLRENGINVSVSDLCGKTRDQWEIDEGDVYGISLTTPQFHLAQEVAEVIRTRQPEATIVMGGYHATAEPKHTLEKTVTDYVVTGDGEVTMLEIARGQRSLDTKIINSLMIPPEEMQNLPWPARDLIDIDQYHKVGTNANVGGNVQEIKEGHLITSRGCPFKCGFCAQMAISKFRVRYRDEDDVFREMEHLGEEYGCNRFYMFDDIFIVDKKQVFRLCDRFGALQKKFPFDWHALARVDVPKTEKDLREVYERMYEAGCRQLTYGIEHASNTILDRIQKHTTKEQSMIAIKAAHDVGMRVRAQMIVGLPGETHETIEEMAQYIRDMPVHSWGIHVFVPLPGSPVWTTSDEKGHSNKFNFRFKKMDTFEYYQTIGRPGEWAAHHLHENPDQIRDWAEYIRGIAGKRNAYTYDSRWKERSETARALYAADGSC